MIKRTSRARPLETETDEPDHRVEAELVNLASYQRLAKRERDRLARLNRELETRVDRLVAERLRDRRITIGMTQQELADRIGVAAQQVHRYERGDSRVTSGRLSQLAEALGVSVEFFFGLRTGRPKGAARKR